MGSLHKLVSFVAILCFLDASIWRYTHYQLYASFAAQLLSSYIARESSLLSP